MSRSALIGDYSQQNEECCGAALPADAGRCERSAGPQRLDDRGIERALGGIIEDDTFARKTSITPGRDYAVERE